MKNSVTTRTYKRGDEGGIVQFLARYDKEFTSDIWKWKYHNTPGKFISIAEYDNQVVGHMALLPMRMKVGRETITGCMSVDLFVNPDFRRQGIFLSLTENLVRSSEEERVPLMFGFPTPLSYHGHLKRGHFHVGNIRIYARPVDIRGYLQSHSPTSPNTSVGARSFSRVLNTSLMALSKILWTECNDVEITRHRSFDNRFNRLWHRVSKRHEIIVVRDREYLEWRYSRRSDKEYVVFVAETDEDIAGYIIVAKEKHNGSYVGKILDILSERDEVLQMLLQYGIEYLLQEEVGYIGVWAPACFSRRILGRTGFLPSRRTERIVARLNSPQFSEQSIDQLEKWYVTWGDLL